MEILSVPMAFDIMMCDAGAGDDGDDGDDDNLLRFYCSGDEDIVP